MVWMLAKGAKPDNPESDNDDHGTPTASSCLTRALSKLEVRRYIHTLRVPLT